MNLSPGGYVHEANVHLDLRFEEQLLERVPDALVEEGDAIYIRKVGGRLFWLKGNVTGASDWKELTPALSAEKPEDWDPYAVADNSESLEELRNRMVHERETYKIGWYQDSKGDLYEYGLTGWAGTIPNRAVIKTLEYLG